MWSIFDHSLWCLQAKMFVVANLHFVSPVCRGWWVLMACLWSMVQQECKGRSTGLKGACLREDLPLHSLSPRVSRRGRSARFIPTPCLSADPSPLRARPPWVWDWAIYKAVKQLEYFLKWTIIHLLYLNVSYPGSSTVLVLKLLLNWILPSILMS